jgi:hypothetical protein
MTSSTGLKILSLVEARRAVASIVARTFTSLALPFAKGLLHYRQYRWFVSG